MGKVTKSIAEMGVEFEKNNILTSIMEVPIKGIICSDFLDEKILSALIEFIIPTTKLIRMLQ